MTCPASCRPHAWIKDVLRSKHAAPADRRLHPRRAPKAVACSNVHRKAPMPSDLERWNARYLAQAPVPAAPQPWLVEHQALLPPTGLAFDLAMGLGGSAGWLAERGWRAAGADISEVAVRRAKARWPALLACVADLQQLVVPK